MGTSKEPTQYGWEFLLPSAILLGLVFVYPIALFLSKSFLDPEPTLRHVIDLFDTDIYVRVIWITFRISFTVTVACVLLGYPIAYLLSEVSERTRNLLMIMVLIPFWTSLLVRTYAWMVLLGRRGVFNSIIIRLGIFGSPIRMLHNSFDVNVRMIQMIMPFMI